jgi:hypothetical protein
VETTAALALISSSAPRAAPHLRAAVEGDPGNADRWMARQRVALKPDPLAAADALDHARAAESSLRVARDSAGWLARESAPATP